MIFDRVSKKGADFLGVKYPILGGAMSWVSDCDLVSAISNAGAFGVLAGGNIPPQFLAEEIEKTRKQTSKPFGVNLITVSPIFKEQLKAVAELRHPYIVFAGGLPSTDDIKLAKESGAKVFAFAPTLKMGERMVEAGADALIIEGHEAGGHVGPTSTIVLIQKVLYKLKDTPVFVAGGIGTGKMVAHLLLMGAAGVQMGTRFVLTHEANVNENTKKAFLKAGSKDAMVSFSIDKRLPVIPVRALKNKGSENFIKLQVELVGLLEKGEITVEEAGKRVEEYWLGALRKAVKEGDTQSGSLMAGHSIGLIKDIKTVQEVIEELVREAEKELQEVKKMIL